MKYFSLLFLLIGTFKINAQSTIYHPFPDSNAVWNGILLSGTVPPFPGISGGFHYQLLNKDTIVGLYNYRRINSITAGWLPSLIGIRQDIPNKKVYGVYNGSLNDTLLYDFNLNIGDTFSARPLTYCNDPSIVNSVDSILINGTYRKRINFNSSVSFIEGIGSTTGLVEYNCFEGMSELCIFYNELDTFKGSSLCNQLNKVDDFKLKYVSISPNLLQDNTNPTIYNTLNIPIDIKVLNQFGETKISIKNLDKSIQLDFNPFSVGLYFVIVSTINGEQLTEKILKE